MLELPESYTIAKQMNEVLKGKVITDIMIMQSPHRFAFFKGDMDAYPDYLVGQTVKGATYHGGMIELDTEDSMLIFSDGANVRYYEDKRKFPQKHQLAIYFEDETALFVTIQMYAVIGVFPIGTCTEEYYLSALTKPDPLSKEFTYDYFRDLYRKSNKKLSAKAFLATEQRIPGLGNGVLQDVLWEAEIDPRDNVEKLTEEEWYKLYQAVVNMLRKMCEQGGRDTEKDLYGQKCGYITQLSKNSLHEPCMKCGCEISKASYMGGTIYFCEQCQKRKNENLL